MLIKCKECGRQVSSSAESCPHCGNTKFLEQHRYAVQEDKKEREEAEARYEKQARSEGFKNGDEKRKAENKKQEKKARRRELKDQIIGAGCLITILVLSLAVVLYFVIMLT